MDRVKKWLKRDLSENYICIRVLGFILLTLVLFIYSKTLNIRKYDYSAASYWNLADTFRPNGWFEFTNYVASKRGYFFPFILFCAKMFGSRYMTGDYTGFWLFHSLIWSWTITVILPAIIGKKTSLKRWCIGTIVCFFLIVYFWRDLVAMPMSDGGGLIFFATGVVFMKVLMSKRKIYLLIKLALAGSAGMLFYAAYNTRTIFLIPTIVAIIVYLFTVFWKRQYKDIFVVAAILIGFFVVSIPQVMINQVNFNSSTPMVITTEGDKDNLFIAQLEWGLWITHYETFIGEPEEYPSPQMVFTDKTGKMLVDSYQINSISDYIKCVLSHPIEMMGIYMEHAISGITLFWNRIYISHVPVNTICYLLNTAVFMLCVFSIITTKADLSKIRFEQGFALLLFLSPAICILPGAVETRFFIPVYLFAYACIAWGIDYVEIWCVYKKDWIKNTLFFAVAVLVWCMVSVNLLNKLEGVRLDLLGNVKYM